MSTTDAPWMRLPDDADGEPIHIGDTMEWVNDKSIIRTVSGVGLDVFFAWVNETERYSQCEASAYRHHHEPTVEDVLREFANKVCSSGHQWGLDAADTITEYAEKLREVVEHDCD